jgi:hypothetical protein
MTRKSYCAEIITFAQQTGLDGERGKKKLKIKIKKNVICNESEIVHTDIPPPEMLLPLLFCTAAAAAVSKTSLRHPVLCLQCNFSDFLFFIIIYISNRNRK